MPTTALQSSLQSSLPELRSALTDAKKREVSAIASVAKVEAAAPQALQLPAASLAAGLDKGEGRRQGNLRIASAIVATLPQFATPAQQSTEAGRVLSALARLSGFAGSVASDSSALSAKAKRKVAFAGGLSLADLSRMECEGHKSLAALALAASLASAYRRKDSATAAVARAQAALDAAVAETPAAASVVAA